jgi:hypothetical protein
LSQLDHLKRAVKGEDGVRKVRNVIFAENYDCLTMAVNNNIFHSFQLLLIVIFEQKGEDSYDLSREKRSRNGDEIDGLFLALKS